jgi:hypothetical protein
LLSWNFLSVSCAFWLTISSIISIKFSLSTCSISSFRLFLWASLESWHNLSSFSWSLELSICFLHFPLVPVLIFCCGETGFPVFSVFPSLPLVLLLSLCCVQFSIFSL